MLGVKLIWRMLPYKFFFVFLQGVKRIFSALPCKSLFLWWDIRTWLFAKYLCYIARCIPNLKHTLSKSHQILRFPKKLEWICDLPKDDNFLRWFKSHTTPPPPKKKEISFLVESLQNRIRKPKHFWRYFWGSWLWNFLLLEGDRSDLT